MSKKSARIAEMVRHRSGEDLDPRYLGFFDCFNRGEYFEAHEVLEDLWLERKGEDFAFYKGLIQIAGAFVHLGKGRPRPAVALMKLAKANLSNYSENRCRLDLRALNQRLSKWIDGIEGSGFELNAIKSDFPPRLLLEPAEAKQNEPGVRPSECQRAFSAGGVNT